MIDSELMAEVLAGEFSPVGAPLQEPNLSDGVKRGKLRDRLYGCGEFALNDGRSEGK